MPYMCGSWVRHMAGGVWHQVSGAVGLLYFRSSHVVAASCLPNQCTTLCKALCPKSAISAASYQCDLSSQVVCVMFHGVLWCSGSHVNEGDPLELMTPPTHVLQINTNAPQHLTCSAISPSGSIVAASDCSKLRLFVLTQQDAERATGCATPGTSGQQAGSVLGVKRLKLSTDVPPATCMVFSSDSQTLYCSDGHGCIRAVDLSDGSILASSTISQHHEPKLRHQVPSQQTEQEQHTAEMQQRHTSTSHCPLVANTCCPAVTHMAVAPNGRSLAAVTRTHIEIFELPGLTRPRKLMLLGASTHLDQVKPPVTCLAYTPDSSIIAVVNAANSLATYTADTCRITDWTKANHETLDDVLDKIPGYLLGLSFKPSIEVQGAAVLCVTLNVLIMCPTRLKCCIVHPG